MLLFIFTFEGFLIGVLIGILFLFKYLIHYSVMLLKCPQCKKRFTLQKKYSAAKIIKKNSEIKVPDPKVLDASNKEIRNEIYCNIHSIYKQQE